METECLYKIKDFDLPQFVMDLDVYDEGQDVDGKNQMSFAYNDDWRILRGTVVVKFYQSGKTILTMQIVTYVELEEQTVERLKDKDHIRIPKELLHQTASFGYGALRGIMYIKTMNTPFSHLILPPFNIEEAVKDDLTFKIRKD